MAAKPFFQQPPEIRLLGALSRPVALGDTGRQITAEVFGLCGEVDSWDYFLEVARHHRVIPLLAQGVSLLSPPLPEEVLSRLRAHSAANAREAFRYLSQLHTILEELRRSGIRATVLKGVPLSVMAFGNPAIRDVGDIDLLIDPADAKHADIILQDFGLVRQEPAAFLTRRRWAFYTKYHKDLTYFAESQGFEVDVHWRLLRDREAARRILTNRRAVDRPTITLGSINIEVLQRDECLVYLAVHGALEGWARWKSLADVAALWSRATPEERESTRLLAGRSDSTPFLSSALTLAGLWLGEPLIAEDDLPADSGRAAYIVGYAQQQMMKTGFKPSPAGATTFTMKWHEARLRPSPRSLLDLAMRVLFRARMWELLDLPDSLFFLYPFFSPLEWLLFRLRIRLAGKSQ